MVRLTAWVSDEQKEWVESEAERHDVEQAAVVRQLIDAARFGDSPLDSETDSVFESHSESEVDSLRETVAELEQRVESLESSGDHQQTGETRSRTASRPPEPRGERAEDPAAEQQSAGFDVENDIEEQISELELPGKADSTDGRRAIRAMYDYVRREGRASKSDFIEDVYSDHPVRYGSGDSWWNAVGRETEGREGFVTLAERRDDLHPPAGRGSQYFEYAGRD